MIHEILPVGPLQCNCSIIGDETTREAMVIDPGDNIQDVLALIRKHNLSLSGTRKFGNFITMDTWILYTNQDTRNRTVRNLDAWYDAFDVEPGQRLYLEPAARVRIW